MTPGDEKKLNAKLLRRAHGRLLAPAFSRLGLLFAVCTLFASLSAVGTAVAAAPTSAPATTPSTPRVRLVVARFSGPGANVARNGVIQALTREGSVELLSVRQLDAKKNLDLDVASDAHTLAEALDVAAILRGRVAKLDRNFVLEISVVGRSDDQPAETLTYTGATLQAVRDQANQKLWSELEPLLDRASAPTPEREKPPEAPPEPRKPVLRAPVPVPPKVRTCPWLSVEATGGVLLRWFNYRGEESGALRAYALKRAPELGIAASFYPFAHSQCTPLSALGVRARYQRAFGITSRLSDRRLSTSSFAAGADLLFRIPLDAVVLTPRIGYAARDFEVDQAVVPAARYSALALGIDVSFRYAMLFAELGATGQYLFGIGELASATWFPQARAFGYDVELRLGVRVSPLFEPFLAGQYEAYALSLNPVAGGSHPNGVAASAYDRYARALFGVRFNLETTSR